ncbi:MAG TPA: O-antigen ligase family protein [Bryobacteraceae bacterium]|nr:O-antigen ligase family protein [Bryobacteraceae bacterium]
MERAGELRQYATGAMLAGYAAAVALTRGATRWTLAALVLLVPLLHWILLAPNAWLALFFAVALLAPPLPVAFGNSGPHPALAMAMLGAIVGFLRLAEWRFQRGLVPGVLVFFFTILAVSLGPAALYSGPEIASQSLARVLLAGISAYVFFYTSAGPGRSRTIPLTAIHWFAMVSAAFACVDFFYQFPAPAGFGPQYIWLASGVYRRAQGLFYEASTLGNFCAFFLVMTGVALVRGIGSRLVLLGGGAIFTTALIFSYSRSSMANVAIAFAAIAVMERKRPAVRRMALLGGGVLVALVIALFRFFPAYAELYWVRLSVTFDRVLSSNELTLSGRAETWRVLGNFLYEHPWHALLGVGYKTLPYSDFIGRPVVADNMYLSMLVETGILGLAALVALNFAIVRAGYRAARSGDPQKSFYGTWIFCFWIAEAVQMLSADLLTFWRVLPLYFWVLAMAIRRQEPPV